MAQVADQGAVGLVQRNAAARAFIVVRLSHVQRDRAAVVPGHDARLARQVGQKGVGGPGVGRCAVVRRLQAEPCQGVEQLAFGFFDANPVPQVAGVGKVGQPVGLAAGNAQQVGAGSGHGKVAGVPGGVVVAKAVERARLHGSQPPPQAHPGIGRRGQRRHGDLVGQKSQRAGAVHALHAVEEHHVAAVVAIEDLHRAELIPVCHNGNGPHWAGRCL